MPVLTCPGTVTANDRTGLAARWLSAQIRRMTDLEKQNVVRGVGKWGDPSVPKRGWTCIGYEDTRRRSEHL